ncbi:MAG: SAM-dependent methyltransferase [Calditrichaeota bacterium]|nr:MAG: SAM-dependent methyltransferase [Calditrichota bacterium]
MCAKAVPFEDHFSGHAGEYARYRPGYPGKLFSFLASLCRDHGLAWDCATGNGQAARKLATHFRMVIATDASEGQLAHAFRHPGVCYMVASAEAPPLAPATADLITVAQAAHWLDLDQFYAQARKVLKPGGIIALWAYGLFHISAEIDALLHEYYHHTVGPFWPPQRKWIDEKYQTLPFPFGEIPAPSFPMVARWDLSRVLGYIGTWSATRRYLKHYGRNPLEQIRQKLETLWGEPARLRTVQWPIYLRVGKHTSSPDM